MGRAKIPMEPITNPRKRKSTFNSRNNGMIKKARELAILCDVKVSMIIFSDDQQTPQIFPPDDHDKLTRSIDVYSRTRRTNPESIKGYTLSDYYNERKMKVEEELVKEKRKNLEAKFPSWFGFLDGFSEAGLRGFAVGLEEKIVDVQSLMDHINIMGPSDPMMNLQMMNGDYVTYDVDNFGLEPPLMMLNEDHNDNMIYNGGNFSSLMDRQYCFAPDQSWQQFFMYGLNQ